MSKLKEQLYLLCTDYIKKKETEIKKIIAEASEAANNDTKSSAGDKFETGREIMQQEIDLNITRLNEINKLKLVMERILPDQKSVTVQPGSIVCTNNGNYYIAISSGQLKADGALYFGISAASPIGEKMIGQKSGYQFTLNGKTYKIESVA